MADQTRRRAESSMSTIGSRTTMPLPKVTMRSPRSSFVSVTNPGTSRVCRAPMSRKAAQTSSTLALVNSSFRIEAMFFSDLQVVCLAARRNRYDAHQPAVYNQLAVVFRCVFKERDNEFYGLGVQCLST